MALYRTGKPVMRSVPQEFTLGPVLFSIYINHTVCTLNRFADHTKLRVQLISSRKEMSVKGTLTGLGCHLCEPHEVEECQVKGPAPLLGKSPGSVQTWE